MARFANGWRWLCSIAFIFAAGTGDAWVPLAVAEEACQKPTDVTVVQLLNRWRAEFATGDADRIAGLYAVNATLIATKDGKAYKGRDAIRGYYKDFLVRRPGLSIKPAELTPGCGIAVIRGPVVYRLTGERKGTRILLGGRFTAEFALVDGAWLIVRHSLAADPRSVGEAFGEAAAKTPPL
ncbi:nuclear transport factor 2 family protein [Hyphomicrobium sp.]|uniref:nuclear transport factor 2 family protein n=1 Tax=Hyphomicrobium sp. TaxID=82 RepID=UPI000FB9A287|nr:nuclear transport factor 2 family protein [Hyphomicrobium sp.]RUO99586.1 MAG: DUF4440 domain-containing protein [Hyphomicrobium sp.]